MRPGPSSSGTWSPSRMSLLLHRCFQWWQEMHLSWVLRMLHWMRCSGGWSLWRQISNDGGQHISTLMVEYYSTSFRANLTGLRCRGESVCPLIQCALQAMGPGATLCRTTMPLLTELGSSQIACHPLSRFGSHQFLDSEWLKISHACWCVPADPCPAAGVAE